MLTERQTRILELVIGEHVETALPVGSQHVSRKYQLGASPATVRSEMADLEEQGYLTHPHTSSGRVPTGKGYRLYVERVMREEQLPWEAKQTIRHQFHQVDRGEESWLHLAASILAQAVGNAAVVTPPRTDACRLRHIELVGLHDRTALLIVVLEQGRLHQQVLTLDDVLSQDELSAVSAKLNGLFANRGAEHLALDSATLTAIELSVATAVREIMRAVDSGGLEHAYLEGLRHLLSQPEFASSERLLGLLDVLDERNFVRAVPIHALATEGVSVIIGAESPGLLGAGDAIRACSVVISTYGAPGVASGAVAVLGPMRMRYPSTVSTVRYLAGLMSEMLSDDYP